MNLFLFPLQELAACCRAACTFVHVSYYKAPVGLIQGCSGGEKNIIFME